MGILNPSINAKLLLLLQAAACFLCITPTEAFVSPRQQQQHQQQQKHQTSPFYSSSLLFQPPHSRQQDGKDSSSFSSIASQLMMAGYVPPELAYGDASTSGNTKKRKYLYPKVGDIVRYFDLDGGKADGQVLVGKISYIQQKLDSSAAAAADNPSDSLSWIVEVTQMDDLGDGFYGDFPARQRQKKKTIRDVLEVAPISASFVRVENAYRIPMEGKTGRPKVRAEQYDIEGYQGPLKDPENAVDQTVLETDAVIYKALKNKLLRYVAISGVAGTIICELVSGLDYAIIYFGGVLASLGYLFLLSLKADTVGLRTKESEFSKNLSNLRFFVPLFVLIGVALWDKFLGESGPLPTDHGLFNWVTKGQFVSAALGFVSYRVPLFYIQIQMAFNTGGGEGDGNMILPGSAGIAMQLVADSGTETTNGATSLPTDTLATVLLVSGPQATGRSELVQKLIQEDPRFVALNPTVDRVKEGATYDRLEQREEFIQKDRTGRFGWTKAGILKAAKDVAIKSAVDMENGGSASVLVADANVDFAKQLTNIPGLRIVGIWVGLNSMQEFEKRLNAEIDAGKIEIPEDEARESVLRGRVRQIVKEIEYGISSGIFEFTVLNVNEEESMKQLKEAASYSFR